MKEKSKQTTRQDQNEQSDDNIALCFYSIIFLGFVLPVIIAGCAIFVKIPVQIILWAGGLLLLGSLAYVYIIVSRQLRALQKVVEHLNELDADTEINLPGGLVQITIEHNPRKALLLPSSISSRIPAQIRR